MNHETKKIPVSFELEIQTEPGEQWELCQVDTQPFNIQGAGNVVYTHPIVILRRVEPLETECEWRLVDNCLITFEASFAVYETGRVSSSSWASPAPLRDAAKILEHIEKYGALPQTKKREAADE